MDWIASSLTLLATTGYAKFSSAEGARSREGEIAHAASVTLDPVLACYEFMASCPPSFMRDFSSNRFQGLA